MTISLKFPVNERVKAGVSYKEMLQEVGAGGALIIVALIIFQLGTVFGWSTIVSVIITLSEFGCSVNTHIADNYLVISIPLGLLYQPIRTLLINHESSGNIDFSDCLSRVHAAMV